MTLAQSKARNARKFWSNFVGYAIVYNGRNGQKIGQRFYSHPEKAVRDMLRIKRIKGTAPVILTSTTCPSGEMYYQEVKRAKRNLKAVMPR